MTRAALALAAAAALGSACTLTAEPAPTIESVAPASVAARTATTVAVRGSGFAPSLRADLDDPASSTVRGGFALTLVHGAERVPLADVAFVSERELSALVPPLAERATYDLELVDPRGRTARLAGALGVERSPGCGPDGTPCDDGDVCTEGDACRDGVCAPGAPACGNTAPRACLSLTRAAVATGEPIGLDASCSSDGEDAPSALRARIDFDGDGIWDTPFEPVGTAWEYTYPSPRLWTATVEVVDSGGLSDFASRYALVTAAGDLVLVTTAEDESDAGATPAAPGGGGLSLREAIAYVNGLRAPRTIRLAVASPIVHASALPELSVAAAAIVGDRSAPLQFHGVSLPCVTLDAPHQLLLGVTVSGCTATAVALGNASDDAQVAECNIVDVPGGHGISGKASGTVGPRNEIAGADTAMKLVGSTYLVEENRIHGNDQGIVAVAGIDLTVRRNRITSNVGAGLQATPSPGSCSVVHNVFDANGKDAVSTASFAKGLVARNNLFTRNGGFAIRDGSPVATLDHNGFHANGLGDLASGAPGPTDVLADPLYAGDHRLSPGSPAVDRGAVTDLDVNGPAAGLFDGAAPDLGAWEAPYPLP